MVRVVRDFIIADLVVCDSFVVRSRISVDISSLLVVIRCEIMWSTGISDCDSGRGGDFCFM